MNHFLYIDQYTARDRVTVGFHREECDGREQNKILMVDDEPDLKPLVMSRMRRDIRAGRYEFIFAEDGVEAVGILYSDKDIDIIITDINMPRMDGLTLLNEISKINPDTVTIVVSAYGDMPNIRTAMNRGAFDFVTKPINF